MLRSMPSGARLAGRAPGVVLNAARLEIRNRHEHDTVAIVSHADVIRAVLGHLLGTPMDHLLRLDVAPASFSTIELHRAWPQVVCMGRTASPP